MLGYPCRITRVQCRPPVSRRLRRASIPGTDGSGGTDSFDGSDAMSPRAFTGNRVRWDTGIVPWRRTGEGGYIFICRPRLGRSQGAVPVSCSGLPVNARSNIRQYLELHLLLATSCLGMVLFQKIKPYPSERCLTQRGCFGYTIRLYDLFFIILIRKEVHR